MISLPPPTGRRPAAATLRRSATCRPPRPAGVRPVTGRSRPASPGNAGPAPTGRAGPVSLARALSAAEGRERERIASVLHDEVGALIVRIRLRMSEWRLAHPRLPAPEVDEMCAWVGKLSHTVRTLTTALAPPAWHGGLPSALEAMTQELGLGMDTRGPRVRVEAGGADFDVPESLRNILCRVVRELCLNVLKHAKAHRLDITPRLVDGWLCIQVQDDGVGLPDAPESLSRASCGLGLAGSRAQLRAIGGSLHLRWEAGRGTCATVLVPLPGRAASDICDLVELPQGNRP
ncbi:sensor histidine kinase [Roseateles terrae]|uniref:histidine kinase n=1 Tax=Roseateles terrae TaxID=431060 RepID=A0ABR6GM69_9BURK|nr:ATP-binding protein [Roseateles terrae]MBB3193194.1 signal transduction histidine kinase [Roseateles terrae]OWQ89588.1 hypothetical protein CDN98_03425 [Roseateles terrae]